MFRREDQVKVHADGSPWRFPDAAAYLSISTRHLIRLADDELVKTIRLGHRRLIPDSEVRRLASQGSN